LTSAVQRAGLDAIAEKGMLALLVDKTKEME